MKTVRVPDARLLGYDGVNVPDVVPELVPAAREPDTDGVHELEPRALIVKDGEPEAEPEKEDDPEKDADPDIHEADCDAERDLVTDGHLVTEMEDEADRERVPDGELEREVVMRDDVLAVGVSTTHVELNSLQTPLAQSLSFVHDPSAFKFAESRRMRPRIKRFSEDAGRSSESIAPPDATEPPRASGALGGTRPGEAASPLSGTGWRPTPRAGPGAVSGKDGRNKREINKRGARILNAGDGQAAVRETLVKR